MRCVCLHAVPPGAIYTEITETAAPEIGKSYKLVCSAFRSVSGLTNQPTAQWYDSSGQVINQTEGTSMLTFDLLKTSHAGSYRCEGSVTSPALEQPLVTNSTWNITVRSKSLILINIHYTTFNVTVPDPRITLTRTGINSDLYARDLLRFTCEVHIHESVNTNVNVSLTWIRGYHRHKTENLTTKYIIIHITNESTPFSVTSKMIINDLSSLDQSISCKSVVYSLEERYILSSGESSQTITFDVTGRCLTVLQVYAL